MDITIDGTVHRMWLSTDRNNTRKLTGHCQCCDWRVNNATNHEAVGSFAEHHNQQGDTTMDTTTRVITIDDIAHIFEQDPEALLVHVQPVRGRPEIWVETSEKTLNRTVCSLLHEYSGDFPTHLWEAAARGDYAAALADDKLSADILKVADLTDDQVRRYRGALTRSGLLEELDGVERDLALTGLAWQSARDNERKAAAAAYAAIRAAVDEGVSEAGAAALGGVTRLTVRRALDKA